jgi:histidinol dehydrogenase
MNVISFSREALKKLGGETAHFAEMEGLDAHANSVLIRSK